MAELDVELEAVVPARLALLRAPVDVRRLRVLHSLDPALHVRVVHVGLDCRVDGLIH